MPRRAWAGCSCMAKAAISEQFGWSQETLPAEYFERPIHERKAMFVRAFVAAAEAAEGVKLQCGGAACDVAGAAPAAKFIQWLKMMEK